MARRQATAAAEGRYAWKRPPALALVSVSHLRGALQLVFLVIYKRKTTLPVRLEMPDPD
jgi:hypothetical protein